ncbi:hypothetical protein [Mariniflexile sp. AS56]|uniref:hypothetical protein n=1 Tax=Mariniflexile sp. AS56 TaxID=3063957 RepID=UPI0026F29F59|nr:hypothetical protein [Mariniflexile sp. AS56]MDO7172252.1 hypothetical protein [Mariniflexile sp. AS56]
MEKDNFELVKDKEDKKRNYIFQKDGITKTTAIIVLVVLLILIIAVVFTSKFL